MSNRQLKTRRSCCYKWMSCACLIWVYQGGLAEHWPGETFHPLLDRVVTADWQMNWLFRIKSPINSETWKRDTKIVKINILPLHVMNEWIELKFGPGPQPWTKTLPLQLGRVCPVMLMMGIWLSGWLALPRRWATFCIIYVNRRRRRCVRLGIPFPI